MNLKTVFSWTKNPTRVIHWVVAALVLIIAIAGDLSNALNGTETWVGAGIAVGNVVQGELNRTKVSPAISTTSSTVTSLPNS